MSLLDLVTHVTLLSLDNYAPQAYLTLYPLLPILFDSANSPNATPKPADQLLNYVYNPHRY